MKKEEILLKNPLLTECFLYEKKRTTRPKPSLQHHLMNRRTLRLYHSQFFLNPCWRGKSPLRIEVIPTSPDRIQKQSNMLQCRFLIANKPTCNEGLPTIQRCRLQKRWCSHSFALAGHNPHDLHDRTPAHARNNTNASIKSSIYNYMSVEEDIIHEHNQE